MVIKTITEYFPEIFERKINDAFSDGYIIRSMSCGFNTKDGESSQAFLAIIEKE